MKYVYLALLMFCSVFMAKAQVSATGMEAPGQSRPWQTSELLEPGELNDLMTKNKAPLVLNLGSVEDIKGAIHIGVVTDAANMAKLKTTLAGKPKSAELVIYCGCCPFGKCPNIRPAYKALKDLGFTNIRVLNLYVNLRTNWSTQGYPLAKDN